MQYSSTALHTVYKTILQLNLHLTPHLNLLQVQIVLMTRTQYTGAAVQVPNTRCPIVVPVHVISFTLEAAEVVLRVTAVPVYASNIATRHVRHL